MYLSNLGLLSLFVLERLSCIPMSICCSLFSWEVLCLVYLFFFSFFFVYSLNKVDTDLCILVISHPVSGMESGWEPGLRGGVGSKPHE